MSQIPKGMPCTRTCESRTPGCYCEKKQAWDAEQAEKKKMIHEMKEREYAVGQVRNPPRAEKRRQKNVH